MIKIGVFFISFLMLSPAFADSFQLISGTDSKTITTQDLERLPLAKITTSTNFKPQAEFEGVPFTTLLKAYGIQASRLRVFALDDYSYTLPTDELTKYHVILAFKKNGKVMPLSELGPYAVIYPRDQHPELNNPDVNARTVWQISSIEVAK